MPHLSQIKLFCSILGLGLFRSSYFGGAKKKRVNCEEEQGYETTFCARLKQNNPFYWIVSALD
jgi:hypothetical protein